MPGTMVSPSISAGIPAYKFFLFADFRCFRPLSVRARAGCFSGASQHYARSPGAEGGGMPRLRSIAGGLLLLFVAAGFGSRGAAAEVAVDVLDQEGVHAG